MKSEAFARAREYAKRSTEEPYGNRFDTDLAFREWLDNVYIPRAGLRRFSRKNPGVPLTKRRVQQLHALARLLTAYLRRPAIVGDLNPQTLDDFREWHKAAFPASSGKWLWNDCNALLRYCRLVPDARKNGGRKRIDLSSAEGTLWNICLTKYFPKSLRIRSDQTKTSYRAALRDFRDTLGHEPTLADLTDDNVIEMMVRLASIKDENGKQRLSEKTINERRGRIVALWNWCAKKRLVEEFPFVQKLPEPRRIPRAWTEDELTRLFHSCQQEEGYIAEGVKACDFWLGIHWFLWSTGERIGAIMACQWEWLDWDTGYIQIDAEFRKGKDADFLHKLRPECLEILARFRDAGHKTLFPWQFNEQTFYRHYNQILKRANFEPTRKNKTHKMRRSVASHLQARGVDACAALGHSSSDVTRKSYIDPRIVAPQGPADVLFNPLEFDKSETPRLPSPAPKRIGHRELPAEPAADELAWL